jgi:hypothetical protein
MAGERKFAGHLFSCPASFPAGRIVLERTHAHNSRTQDKKLDLR